MKNILQFLITVLLSASVLTAAAQQWSDVGDQGFTPSVITASSVNHVDAAITGTTPYTVHSNAVGALVVMKYSAGTWTALPSPDTGSNNSNPTIRVNSLGEPYVAYTNGGINVKKFNGTAWVQVGVANFNTTLSSATGVRCNLDFDSGNVPYVAYLGGTSNTQITIAKFDGTAWVAVGAPNAIGGVFMKFAISPANVPHVVSSNGTVLQVRKFNGTAWVSVGPTSFSVTVGMTDIAFDASDVPYVLSNYNPTTTDLKITILKFNGTAWAVLGVSYFNAGSVGAKASLVIDNASVPYVAYQDANNNNITTVMKYNGTSWVTVGGATATPSSGKYPVLMFDSGNTPHLAYHDGLTADKISMVKYCTSTAAITNTTPGSICGTSGTATLSATGTGASAFFWYNSTGLKVGAGAAYTTPTLTATASYAVAARDASGCSSPRTTVAATLKAVPVITATQPSGACVGGTANIGATADVGSISWYTTPTGGSPFATGIISGSVVTTPTITATTSFYAEAVNNGCASVNRSAVQVTAQQLPANPVAVNNSRCGPGTVSISVTSDPGTVQWFSAAVGGTLLQASGSTFVTPNISSNTTYYANVSAGSCASLARTPVLAIVNTVPTVTSTTPATRCGTGTVILTATLSDEGVINWYTAASGGSAVGTNSFTTPSLTATTTYFAEAVANGCSSAARTAVVATIKPIPTITSNNTSRCGPGTVALTATSDGAMSWFAAASGGSALTTGGNFTTPSLTATTPYFIEATLNGCATLTRTSVSAVVNPIPALPTITADNSNVAAPVLTSSSSTGNQWLRNDVSISGATSNTFTITQEGTYKVQVTLLGCVGAMSAGLPFVVTGAEGFEPNQVQLYPNPAADELVLNLSGFEPKKPVGIVIVDLLGRQTKVANGVGGEEVRIDIREITSGQYIAVMKQGNQQVAKLFVKKF